ncbi:glycosyltransferase family 4 protein [uncultured Jannaschia sp.]|uniref:glycosyltransferase family 4 protein n=1 Tax=uncultured Jannaschia sp. TaxID=293347 RepID=UPI00261789B3|nr:glycosyltransferase family 4 protein [uncultured Jannaschia sp.]
MKILLTHRYFWPDSPPYGWMLKAIAETLSAAGHDVHVLASIPSYTDDAPEAPMRERICGMSVHRVAVRAEGSRAGRVRASNALAYCRAIRREVEDLRPDVVTASSFPPVIAAATASAAARRVGAAFVYHVQDVHPEASRISGGLVGRSPVYDMLRVLDTRTLKRSDAIVTLSEDMAQTIRARGASIPDVTILNNFTLDAPSGHAPVPPDSGRRRAIFAGNMGRFQDLPVLLEGLSLALDRSPDWEVVLMGDGALRADLRARFGDHPRIRFLDRRPYAEAEPIIAGADIGLVSLRSGIEAVAYPSKTETYLGLGLPVLVLADPERALASDIEGKGLGRVTATRDPEDIAAAFAALTAPETLARAKAAVRARPDAATARMAALDAWVDLMARIRAAR